ncbi:MAG: Ig-like domain-containing protein, partial [Gemmatimonadales bacterium]
MAIVWLRSLVRPGVVAAAVCLFTTTCILPTEPRLAAGVEISPNGHNFASLTETFQFTATPKDRDGNAVNKPISWSSDNTAIVTIDPGTGVVTAVDTGTTFVVATVDNVSSSVAVIVDQDPDHLGFAQQPTPTQAGSTIAPAVTIEVRDAMNMRVKGDTSSVTVGIGLVGIPVLGTQTAADGIATFANLSIDSAATYTLTATSGTLQQATSISFAISGGAATSLVISGVPQPLFAGQVFTITVVARDSMGNVADGFGGSASDSVTVALGINPTGDTLRGTTTVRATGGTATFSTLRLRRAAGYTLTASTPRVGVSPAAPAGFTLRPSSPTQLTFTRQPDTTRAGSPIDPPVQVTLQDSLGNAFTDFDGTMQMALGSNPTGATLSGSLDEVAADGVATFPNLRVDRQGSSYTLVVSAPTAPVPSRTSDPFTITAGVATNLVFTEQPSSAQAGSPIRPGIGVKVSVQDDQGNT